MLLLLLLLLLCIPNHSNVMLEVLAQAATTSLSNPKLVSGSGMSPTAQSPIHVQYTQLKSIRLRHFTIRIDSHGVDPALPEVNIREITIQEPSSFLKRGKKTSVDSSKARYDSTRFARSRSTLPEVNIREIMIQESSLFLKRGNKLQSIRRELVPGM